MRKLTNSVTIEIGGQELRCEFDYSPGTPDVMYLANGDPGYPGDAAEFVVTKVELPFYEPPKDVFLRTPPKIHWIDIGDLISGLDAWEQVNETAWDTAQTEGLFEPEDREPEPRDDY